MTAWIPVGWECAAADTFSQYIADVWPLIFSDQLFGCGILFSSFKCDTYTVHEVQVYLLNIKRYFLLPETFHILQSCYAYSTIYTG